MNIFQAITSRRSAERFDDRPVDEKLVGLMLHMATYAHSAGNMQEWEFIVVEDNKIKLKIAEAALKQKQVADAPIDIIVCADLEKASSKYGKRGEIAYALQDASAAATNIVLTATALGLSTNWVASFDDERMKDILGLPDNLRPVAIVAVGYPAEETEEIARHSFEDVTYLNEYGNKIFLEFKPIANALEKKIMELSEKYKEVKPKKKIDIKEMLKRALR